MINSSANEQIHVLLRTGIVVAAATLAEEVGHNRAAAARQTKTTAGREDYTHPSLHVDAQGALDDVADAESRLGRWKEICEFVD